MIFFHFCCILLFVYVSTHCLEIVKWLDYNRYSQLTQEVPGSIPGSGKGFYVWIFVLLLLCFYFFCQNTSFVTKVCNSCYNVNLFSILNMLQDLWPAIRVYRYRPSIFKILIIPFNKKWSITLTMDRSTTVNHDHLKQYMVNFNPID